MYFLRAMMRSSFCPPDSCTIVPAPLLQSGCYMLPCVILSTAGFGPWRLRRHEIPSPSPPFPRGADLAACEAMVARTVEAFGGLDVLVNNAATFVDLPRRRFLDIGTAEWDRVMAINVRGSFNCAKAAVPALRKRGGGSIVNIASSTALKGIPFTLHYVTSKGAIIAMTRAMARELGNDGIRVNALAPGLTLSEAVAAEREMFAPYIEASLRGRALKRDQMPDDLVGAAVFLASDASAFMTGQTLVVDGGDVAN